MKPYGYYLLLACLSTTPALAQRRFSVAATVAPLISHTSARSTFYLPGLNNGSPIAITESSRTTIGGYLIGLSAHYAVSANWSVSAGLWYSRLLTSGPNPFSPTATTMRIIGQSIQVPLLLNYRLTAKRLSPYFSAGAIANFPLPTLYQAEAGSGQEDFNVKYSKAVTWTGLLGAGVSYQINRHLTLTVQPMLLWRFKPNSSYDKYVSYQLNGQTQLIYTF